MDAFFVHEGDESSKWESDDRFDLLFPGIEEPVGPFQAFHLKHGLPDTPHLMGTARSLLYVRGTTIGHSLV
jgi:hypothetical protein